MKAKPAVEGVADKSFDLPTPTRARAAQRSEGSSQVGHHACSRPWTAKGFAWTCWTTLRACPHSAPALTTAASYAVIGSPPEAF